MRYRVVGQWAAGFLLSFACSYAHAQLSISAPQTVGLIGISPEVADFGTGCSTTGKVPIPARALIDIENLCEPGKWRADPVPPTACSGGSFPVLGILFRGQRDVVLAEYVALAVKYFHMRLFGALEDVHGNRQDIAAIQRVEWCAGVTSVPSLSSLPTDSCRESRQFAVAFDYGAPLKNKILTNGFSIYIRVSGRPPVDFEFEKAADEVLTSFGRALTIWMAALQDNDAMLTAATRAFINTRKSTSGGYVLLTPPQVVRMRCPNTATFIVELNFGGDQTFPARSSFRTLAKARLEGRTIALNMRDLTCFRTMPEYHAGQLSLNDERCANLLPILTHELGHAFGVDHIPSSEGWALMNPVLSNNATTPNRMDVSALVAALERSVAGARPGELEFREAAALQAPLNWTHPCWYCGAAESGATK